MIFGDFNRIIFRDFKVEAARLIAEEIREQKPADEFQLAGMLADLGAQALVNAYGDVCVLTNIKGLYEEHMKALGTKHEESEVASEC
ncbi:MAG: HDOD domain-containing protein [Hungatella sp.]|nr:HDOD domain-containing protein [Hungatella sp.]